GIFAGVDAVAAANSIADVTSIAEANVANALAEANTLAGISAAASASTAAGDENTMNVASFWYTPFGERMVVGSANTANITGYGYNGEMYDAATGMVHLRARQYEPSMMRFGQNDLLRGYLEKPISLNRYAFVWNNPARYVDPSGMETKEQAMTNAGSAASAAWNRALDNGGGIMTANNASTNAYNAYMANWEQQEKKKARKAVASAEAATLSGDEEAMKQAGKDIYDSRNGLRGGDEAAYQHAINIIGHDGPFSDEELIILCLIVGGESMKGKADSGQANSEEQKWVNDNYYGGKPGGKGKTVEEMVEGWAESVGGSTGEAINDILLKGKILAILEGGPSTKNAAALRDLLLDAKAHPEKYSEEMQDWLKSLYGIDGKVNEGNVKAKWNFMIGLAVGILDDNTLPEEYQPVKFFSDVIKDWNEFKGFHGTKNEMTAEDWAEYVKILDILNKQGRLHYGSEWNDGKPYTGKPKVSANYNQGNNHALYLDCWGLIDTAMKLYLSKAEYAKYTLEGVGGVNSIYKKMEDDGKTGDIGIGFDPKDLKSGCVIFVKNSDNSDGYNHAILYVEHYEFDDGTSGPAVVHIGSEELGLLIEHFDTYVEKYYTDPKKKKYSTDYPMKWGNPFMETK
ncbi:MAG: RHS repeat-associated core domain-containing protein, partial [Firmicutes bacterium]|nr:RHS repeat-associated core domain-containing protein [Bacillota bacterium]